MIQVQTLDRKIWRKELLLVYLHECANQNIDAVIDFAPEGCCATLLGLYKLLDDFCGSRKYAKNRITIKTANMIEHHDEYKIVKCPSYWYEVVEINKWLKDKTLDIQYYPTKRFANFSSRGNWFRLWIATILDTYYPDKTLQTYHYDTEKENYNANGYVGVDDLFRYKCDLIPEAIRFLQTCPRTVDLEFLQNLDNCKDSIYQYENSYYPIQHPSNLNLLQYYNDIFVDVIAETNISGNCFFATEKLWRCIVAHRPFVVISNTDYLKNLRKLGFKTFNKWWSEEYDLYGGQYRIRKVQSVLEDINNMSMADSLIDMSNTLKHNFNTFKNLTLDQIRQTFDV